MKKNVNPRRLSEIQKILALMDELKVPAGTMIFKEGAEDHFFYLITQGEVEIGKNTTEGKRKVIAHLKAGDLLGEGVLSGAFEKPASASALGEVRLMRLEDKAFAKLLKEDAPAASDFLLSVLETVNQRLIATDEKVVALHEMNELMDQCRDDLPNLARGIVQKLMSQTQSAEGMLILKNPFEESCRVVHRSSETLDEHMLSEKEWQKAGIRTLKKQECLVAPLGGLGAIVLCRAATAAHYEDEALRLALLVAEQVARTIADSSFRAAEKAKALLHRHSFTL